MEHKCIESKGADEYGNASKMPKVNAFIFSAEEDDAIVQLSENPVPETDFVRHCAQRRKYPILLKVKHPNLFKVPGTQ